MTEIDFYILPDETAAGGLTFAARLAEKVLRGRHQLVLLTDNEAQAQALSDQLWSARPESFVAHSLAAEHDGSNEQAIICHQAPPGTLPRCACEFDRAGAGWIFLSFPALD